MGLVYKASLPPVGAPDVVTRTLELTIDGVKEFIDVVPPTLNSIELPPVKEGATVSIRLRDIDDRKNSSLWGSDVTFVSADTIAPPAPGQVSVELVSEISDKVNAEVEVTAPVVEPEAHTKVVDSKDDLSPVEEPTVE